MNPPGRESRSPAEDERRGPSLRVPSSAIPAVDLRGARNSPLPCPDDLPLRVGIHGGAPAPRGAGAAKPEDPENRRQREHPSSQKRRVGAAIRRPRPKPAEYRHSSLKL